MVSGGANGGEKSFCRQGELITEMGAVVMQDLRVHAKGEMEFTGEVENVSLDEVGMDFLLFRLDDGVNPVFTAEFVGLSSQPPASLDEKKKKGKSPTVSGM